MSISGHKDKRNFYSYILLSGKEVEEEITAKLKELEKQKKEDKKGIIKRKPLLTPQPPQRWLIFL